MQEVPAGSLCFPTVVSAEELKRTPGLCLFGRCHLDAALGEVGPELRCNLEAFFRQAFRRDLEDP